MAAPQRPAGPAPLAEQTNDPQAGIPVDPSIPSNQQSPVLRQPLDLPASLGAQPREEQAPGQEFPPGLAKVLAGPTLRPGEPVTQGLPFGAGASFVQQPNEDNQQFRRRVAQALVTSPGASPDVARFAARLQQGG